MTVDYLMGAIGIVFLYAGLTILAIVILKVIAEIKRRQEESDARN